ncbi:MAG TPA: hypothetical protein VIM30_15590 [Candidatus Limnocylindrales bacterium]|jgi:hypothetical protein
MDRREEASGQIDPDGNRIVRHRSVTLLPAHERVDQGVVFSAVALAKHPGDDPEADHPADRGPEEIATYNNRRSRAPSRR